MPRKTKGSVFKAAGSWGIRWPEDGRRPQKVGFRTRTEARDWFDDTVAPRLRRGGPSGEVTFREFAIGIYLPRWGADVSDRTRRTLERDWLLPALRTFGSFTLGELEGAADDVARWRAALPSDDRRYKATKALRQVLAAAVRWGYIDRNPAVDAGKNPQPRREEVRPLTREERARLILEMAPVDAAIVELAAETGLRTNEWMAIERRDIDRANPAVAVVRRFSRGTATPYPKTSRRRVPLTARAVEALSWLPARIDTPLLFPSPTGLYLDLDNWRLRRWYPALDAAGIPKRGPYELRHTFASEALAAGVSIFELSRLMGASVETIQVHYGHLVKDSERHLRELLTARSGGLVASTESDGGGDSRD